MRSILTTLAVLFLSLTFLSSAEGARYYRYQSGFRAQRTGPIYRLIEFERRKNAWLRRVFFGR